MSKHGDQDSLCFNLATSSLSPPSWEEFSAEKHLLSGRSSRNRLLLPRYLHSPPRAKQMCPAVNCRVSRHASAGLVRNKQKNGVWKKNEADAFGSTRPQCHQTTHYAYSSHAVHREEGSEEPSKFPFIDRTCENHHVPRRSLTLLWSPRCFGAALPSPTDCHGACCSDSLVDRVADCLHGNKKRLRKKDISLGN